MEINQDNLDTIFKNTYIDDHSLVRNKVSFDLKLKQNNCHNKSVFKQKFLSKVSCTNSSYYRYMNGESTPSHKAIKQIYAFILDKSVDEINISDYPKEIKNHFFNKKITNRKNINTILAKSDTHREIYWLTSNNSTLNLKNFSTYHGIKKIMEAINDLLKEEIIQFIDDENITSTTTRAEVNSSFVIENISHLANKTFRRKAASEGEKSNIGTFQNYSLNEKGEILAYNKIYETIDFLKNLEKNFHGEKLISIGLLYEQLNKCFKEINEEHLQ